MGKDYKTMRAEARKRREDLRNLIDSSPELCSEFVQIAGNFKSISDVLLSKTGGLDDVKTTIQHIQRMNEWYELAQDVMGKMLAKLPENSGKKIEAANSDYDDFFDILKERYISFEMDFTIKNAWNECIHALQDEREDAVIVPYFSITANRMRRILGFDTRQAENQQEQLSETQQQISQNLRQSLADDFYNKHPEVKKKKEERAQLTALVWAELEKFQFLGTKHPIVLNLHAIRGEISAEKTSKNWSEAIVKEFQQKIISSPFDVIGAEIKQASKAYLDKYDHFIKKKKGLFTGLVSLFNPHKLQPNARKLYGLADSLSEEKDLNKKLDTLARIADIIDRLPDGELRRSLDNVHDYIIDIVVAVKYPNDNEKNKQKRKDTFKEIVLCTESGFGGTTLSDLVRDAKTELPFKSQVARIQ